jgi:galactose mutarotase-like enzyme
MTVIENEYLKVGISPKGAQLTSLFNKTAGIEHLWQAVEAVWPWHAPNLFPVVGGLVNNEYRVDGQTYTLPRHGFARTSDFELVEASEKHVVFSLAASANTMAVYPYQFAYQVLYDLFDNALRITYKVINLDTKAIYFSVGAHPAFNIPFVTGEAYEDYYLEFEFEETEERQLLSAEGYFSGQTAPVPFEGKKLPLTKSLFDDDALVFKNLKSKLITIKSDKNPHTLSVEYPHYKQMGIWAKQGADFVCIEPWLGYGDEVNPAADLSQKPGIQKLEHGHVFEAPYYIAVS